MHANKSKATRQTIAVASVRRRAPTTMVRIDKRKQQPPTPSTPGSRPTGPGTPGTPGASGGGGGPPSKQQRQLNMQINGGGPGEIAELVKQHAGIMNNVNCATALHRLAKAAATSKPDASLLEVLCARTATTLVREHDSITPRSLTSIVWAVGKFRLTSSPLLTAVLTQARALLVRGELDPFGIANVAWALANVHQSATSQTSETVTTSDDHAGLLDSLASKAIEAPQRFKPQEVCNLLWAFATLKKRHAQLFERFAQVAASNINEFTPQGLSQTVWAYSKLNLSKHSLLLAAASAAMGKLKAYDAQSVATLAWSFANLEVEHRPLVSALCAEAKSRASEFGTASCSQLLWALSRLSDGVDQAAVGAMASRLTTITSQGLNPQTLLYALGALAKLPPDLEPTLPSLLCEAAASTADKLTANKLGIAAWALSRPSVLQRLTPEASASWAAALRRRAGATMHHLGWRSIGYVEMALRQLERPGGGGGGQGGGAPSSSSSSFGGEGDDLVDAMTRAAAKAIDAANERSAKRNAAPLAMLAAHAPWKGLAKGTAVLVAGFDPSDELDGALKAQGLTPTYWRRFACGEQDDAAMPWPPPPKGLAAGAGYAMCLMRWPWYAAGDAASMALRATASVLAKGAPIWLAGNLDEGADNATSVMNGSGYVQATTVASRDGSVLCKASQSSSSSSSNGNGSGSSGDDAAGGLAGWRKMVTLTLPASAAGARSIMQAADENGGAGAASTSNGGEQAQPWVTYPGLFAGGGLDVMTLALLARLPTPPPKARILDACCGSGTIATALHARAVGTGLKALHVLDADAVAIAAAKENVPGGSSSARFFLCDGWPHTPTAFAKKGKPTKYDWVVSNPPVHRGQPDDFRVVNGLIKGAKERLRKGGVLWMVCQQQVPIGRMLALDGGYAWIEADVSPCGRFVVWSAGLRASSSSKKRRRKEGQEVDEDDEDEGEDEEDEEAAAAANKAERKRAKKEKKKEKKRKKMAEDEGR